MDTQFTSQRHARVFEQVLSGLRRVGYGNDLIRRGYPIHDWFLPENPVRSVPAAAFGRDPPSYDTACFAVLLPGQKTGAELVLDYRALGAPVALEVREDRILQWKVGTDTNRIVQWEEFPPDSVGEVFRERKETWSPRSILRAKNVLAKLGPRQLDFIDLGLIPALERHVREKLDRLLRDVLGAATRTHVRHVRREPDVQQLFRLVFRFLAAKVLCDRRVNGFQSIQDSSDPDTILSRVGRYYRQHEPLIEDPATRRVVADCVWKAVDFQNLSVETLAYVYENTLVDDETRREFGTHSTPSSVARYVVSRLIDEDTIPGRCRVVEPCSGHGIFLVAALERLRDVLPSDWDSEQRHRLFVEALQGFEQDAFALEVSKLCLMLADFPFPDGWRLTQADVFASPRFDSALRQADLVLCNPPFGDFSRAERDRYGQLRAVHKPAELLHRVLDEVKSTATLGFVLPRQFVDGPGYREVRQRLAERFQHVEIATLPDRVFRVSRLETTLVIGKEPVERCEQTVVCFREVKDRDRERFLSDFTFSRVDVQPKTPSEMVASGRVLPLREVWQRLKEFPKLGDVAEPRRGVQWQPPFEEEKYISATPKPGFVRGLYKVTPDYFSYETPTTCYLSARPEDRLLNAFDLPWDRPKVILNAARVSRGPWRVAALPDREGLMCSQRFFGIWPAAELTVASLAAVLNAPVANAFVAANEDKRDNRRGTLVRIPMPHLTGAQIASLDRLVEEYRQIASGNTDTFMESEAPDLRAQTLRTLLLRIDALVLRGYGLPARLERMLLDFFRGEKRRVSFPFTEYYPAEFTPAIPLWMYASDDFKRCNSDFLLERVPQVTDPVLVDALAEVE